MTVLEKGKFVKNFVRVDKNGKLIKVKHSNMRGYSSKDIEAIEPLIDESYWANWEHFLIDKKNDEKLMAEYSDYQHFLFNLNEIDDKDIKKYDLPTDYIIIEQPIITE